VTKGHAQVHAAHPAPVSHRAPPRALTIVGVPASGGPFGPNLITPWHAHFGAALPGAALPALRRTHDNSDAGRSE
jgi:hypothetical protein